MNEFNNRKQQNGETKRLKCPSCNSTNLQYVTETETKVELTQNNEKQEFINNLKYNTEDEKELVKRIEEEEIKLEEKKDEELEQINANLSRYLEKIQKEIEKSKTEKNIVENQINKYKEQMEEYQEKMAN